MSIVNLLAWIIFGLVVGGLARLLLPGRDPMGCLATMVVGILGSVVGGFVLSLFVDYGDEFEPAGLIGAVLGAILVLVVYRQFAGRGEDT